MISRLEYIMTKKTKHYINNPDFLQALIDYKTKCDEAKKANKPEPIAPNYIGECFIKLANGVAARYNWYKYTYKTK